MTETAQPTAPIYPNLNKREQPTYEMNTFRLNESIKIQSYLEKEAERRKKWYSRYKTAGNTMSYTQSGMNSIGVILGATGIGLLATIAAIPIGIGLEAATGCCAAIGLLAHAIEKKMNKKKIKHDEIFILAQTTLNTVNDIISKAYKDGVMTDEEFTYVQREHALYENYKKELRLKESTSNHSK